MNKEFPSLADAFLNYFDVDLASTARQREEVGRIRYRVYCEEFGYEPADQFPEGLEADPSDSYSLHCLITHRRSGRGAGCVRLVLASDDHVLPMETHCLENIYVEYLDAMMRERDQVCEFSRLAVDSTFRRRPGEDHTRLGEYDAMDCSHQEQRTFSLVGIAAFLAAFALADLSGRGHLYAKKESNLPRLLRRAGILVQQAGDTTEYHGQRTPYYITSEMAVANMRDDLLRLYQAIHEKLAYSYTARVNVA